MATTNFPNGVTNVLDSVAMGSYVHPDPTSLHTWFDDFDDFDVLQWTLTDVGVGSLAVGNEDGGVLVITNAAADDDHNFLQWAGVTSGATVETFLFEERKEVWVKTRFKVNDATQSDVYAGLYVTDVTPVAGIADGVYFRKADGETTVNLVVAKDSTETVTAVGDLADDTYVTLAYHYNGTDEIDVFFNDARVAVSVTTNLPDDEELAISFGIQNGAGAAKSMNLDYLLVSKER